MHTPQHPSALYSATRSLQERTRWALTGLGLALLVLLVLPSAQIKLGAAQLNGLIGSYGGGGISPPYYDVTYSGGTIATTDVVTIKYTTDTTTQSQSRAYAISISGCGGSGGVSAAGGAGKTCTASANGLITATFTWNNGGDPNALPPPSVTVIQSAGTGWRGNGNSDPSTSITGTADNGLGSPVVPFVMGVSDTGATSSGTTYTLKQDPGQSFQVTCTPKASFSGTTGGAFPVLGSAGVEYTASAKLLYPILTPYIIWTPDYTTAPVNGQIPQVLAPVGTPMGGNSLLRVRVANSPVGLGTLTELRLHFHADADATHDIVFPAVPLRMATTQNQAQAPYAAWAALCGDPAPDPSAPCAYAEVPWNPSAGLRNGVYDLTSAITMKNSDGVTRMWTSPPFTVDREDLLITSTVPYNPMPLFWDPNKINPATGSANPLYLSAGFHAAYKTTGAMTLQVYSSDQTLVRTLTKAVLTTDETTDAGAPMTWDGRGEPVNGQPGEVQPKGVYLFRWSVTDSLNITDTDKSPSLTVSTSTTYATTVSDDGTTAVYQVFYTLTSLDNPTRSASAGQIDIYDSDLAKTFTQTLGASDMTPGAHVVTMTVPSTDLWPSIFLVSALDSDSDTDRGNPSRQRYALQHNNWKVPDKTIAFYYGGSVLGGAILPNLNPQAEGFIKGMVKLGYHRLPGYTYGGPSFNSAYSWSYGDPNVNDIGGTWDNTAPLSSANKRTGALNVDWNHKKLLRTVIFAGHGSADGAVLLLRGKQGVLPSPSQQTYLVSTKSYYDVPGSTYLSLSQKPTKSLILDSMIYPAVSGQPPLGNLDLVLLSGCSQAASTGTVTTLGQEFLILGAQCVVLVGASDQDASNAGAYIDGVQATGKPPKPGFVGYLAQKNGNVPKYNIQQASNLAKKDVDDFNEGKGGSDFDRMTSHSRTLDVNVTGPMWNTPLVMHNP